MFKISTYFRRINKTCFRDRLPLCAITVEKLPKSTAARFSYDETYSTSRLNTKRFINPRISISKVKYLESDVVRLLIHEMTHYEEFLARYRYGTRKRRSGNSHTKKFFLKTPPLVLNF